MKRLGKYAKKIVILLIGLPLMVVGIILIPLPGPGVLVCLLAFFILSLEFDWADKYFQRFKSEINKLLEKSRQRMKELEEKQKEK